MMENKKIMKRYVIRDDGSIFDKEELRTLNLSEIVDLLNKFAENEWERFVNGGH